jgi:hypothetical protein
MIVQEGGRSVGFIPYTPGEFAGRPVRAPRYLFVHCLWVVGRAKEKGRGSRLLGACLEEARATGKRGVAAVTKRGGHLVGKGIFLKHEFGVVDQAPPTFELMERKFGDDPPPALPHEREARQARYGEGLTVVYTDQSPYFHDAVHKTLVTAEEAGVRNRRAVELQSAPEVRELAPCPYGTFGIVYERALLACTPLGRKRLAGRLEELPAGGTT